MKDKKLNLRAWHLAIAEFEEPCKCAISIAAIDRYGAMDAIEDLERVDIILNKETSLRYYHARYDENNFYSDFEKALNAGFSNKIIRTIELTPSDRPGNFNHLLASFSKNQ